MGRYIFLRIIQAIIVLFLVSTLIFFVSHALGDPASLMTGEGATVEQMENVRHQMGLDRPILVQYADFLGKLIRGNLGDSLRFQMPAVKVILNTLPNTIKLAVIAQLFALLVGIPAGLMAATHRNSAFDGITMAFAVVGYAMPSFWLGLMLILVFGVTLHWLPISGMASWQNYVLPGFTLSLWSLAKTARLVRSSMLEVMGQEYVRTARAKGLTERTVLLRHALKNALIPVVTLVSLDFGYLLGGAVIVETIFSWPGLGRQVVTAIMTHDFPMIQASVLIIAVTFVFINVLVDIGYTYLDPRIRYS
jgi:ABC-type dipeptide/oligopeptide/nickel transport system permease component